MIKTIIIVISVFLILTGFKTYKFLKENVKKIPKVSFEEQLKTYNELGYKLNSGITKETLLESYDKSDFEDDTWVLMYVTLGSTIEREPWTPITNDCWHFDAECIEDNGSYIDILENIKRISKNKLNFENIKDFVDIDNEKAWVSFELNGKNHKWNLRIDDDWVDGSIFDKINELNSELNNSRKLTFIGLGQDVVIDYMTEKEMIEFKKATNVKIKWLNGIKDIGE
ncbi:hypothetical protein [Pustulibacterium marinum]|uniref:hypothetical protein n=1 Tax=Pustulibacterium marinum TaxID=1224947 RepID=UPI000B81EEC8|nr:hypothetical protein [Pustulibacterium marinum]